MCDICHSLAPLALLGPADMCVLLENGFLARRKAIAGLWSGGKLHYFVI